MFLRGAKCLERQPSIRRSVPRFFEHGKKAKNEEKVEEKVPV